MTALAADRYNATRRLGLDFVFPIKAGVKIYTGALVVIETATGFAKPGVSAAGLICVGVAQETKDNTLGANGALTVAVKHGTYPFSNPAALTATSIGVPAYIVDDQSVNAIATAQSLAGMIVDVNTEGLWVDTYRKA